MKRPITSPSCAVLTSSETITLIPFARSRASSAPEISLWSVTAIAPRPAALGGVEQHVDGRRAVGRVVGVHVQVAVDEVAPRRAAVAIARRSPAARWRRRDHAPVDALDVVRRPRSQPSSGAAAQAARAQRRPAARRRSTSRASCAASTSASPGSNSRPSSPSREHLLVDRDPRRRPAPRPPRSPSAACASAGASPAEAAHSTSARAEQRLERLASRPRRSRTRSRSAPAEPRRRVHRCAATRPSRATRRSEREAAQRPQEEAQRSALLLGHERDLERAPPGARPGAKRSRSTPGPHDLVVAGEEARDQPARHVEGRQCARRGARRRAR